MRKSSSKPKRPLQMSEWEQVGLLGGSARHKSIISMKNSLHEWKTDGNGKKSIDQKKLNNFTNWKNIFYLIGLTILLIILILDVGVQIGMNHTRQTNFMNNMNLLNRNGVMEKSAGSNISPAAVKYDQNRAQMSNKQMMPSFVKVSDIILRQHVKQTLTTGNLQNDIQKNSPNLGYKIQTSQPVLTPEFNNIVSVNNIQAAKSFPFIPQSMYGNIVIPNPQIYQMPPSPQITQSYHRQVITNPQANRRTFHQIASIGQEQKNNSTQWKNLVDQDFSIDSDLAKSERKYYVDKYNILQYNELPFCVVVPTFNNAKNNRYLNNIRSIIMQEYGNFHIVVIDDGSSDNTGSLIDNFMNTQTKVPKEKYMLITNSVQKKAMPNLRRAAMEFCRPEEIFLIVDGDDQLLGRQVLHFFNAVFQKNQAWFVYTNFLGSTGGIGYSRPFPEHVIQSNSYRSYPFVTSHLRAFYTQLFRNIKEEDLKDEKGEYFYAANDVAICIPILQMSHKRVLYVPELTYYYNSNTGLNNHIVRLNEQKNNDRKARSKLPYTELAQLKIN